jgi:TolB protein
VTPADASISAIGETVQLTAVARDAAGGTIAGRSFTWGTSDGSVASISSAGLVTAVAAGNAEITASTGGISGSASVTVQAATTGTLRLISVTVGRNLDPDGFTVTLNDDRVVTIGRNDTVTVDNVDPGEWTANLTGLSETCYAFEDAPVSGTVIAGSVTDILLEVECLGVPQEVAFTFARSDLVAESLDIVGLSETGGELVPLTFHTEFEREPAWSPDGTRLAFRRGHQIYVMNADGTGLRPVVQGMNPAWSPDGSMLAYDTGVGVFVLDLDGTGDQRFVAAGTEPAWSPDGSMLAVEVDMVLGESDIFVMGADGSNPTNITQQLTLLDREPSWSPDGSRIVFRRLDRAETVGYDLWVMDADGSNQERLLSINGPQIEPVWLPDNRILFSSSGIRIMDLDAGGAVQDLVLNVPGEIIVFEATWRPT